MITMRRYVWVLSVAAALIFGPINGAHSGSDWEDRVNSGTDWGKIRRAAEGGDGEAQIKLGNAYLGDDDVLGSTGAFRQDDVQAYLWLSLGVAGLSNADTDTLMVARDSAIEDLRRLQNRMTPLQLKKAQRFIRGRRGGARQAGQASMIREAQQRLRELGFSPGPADGNWGPRTERAFRSYLRGVGLPDVAFSARALGWIREAAKSAAADTVRAGRPGTSQVQTAQAGDGVTTEEIVYDNGVRYRGQTRGGVPHGQGIHTLPSRGTYEGGHRDGVFHGHGIMTLLNGDRYEGNFHNGWRHGQAKYTWPNGNRYEGDFVKGKMTGRGIFTSPNGDRYEGDFRDGKRHGNAVMTWTNGDRYEGKFVKDSRTGRGTFIWANGNRYEGDFRDGKRHGNGVVTWTNGDRYEGKFVEGKQHGPGVSIKANGRRFRVDFRDGKQVSSNTNSTAPGARSSRMASTVTTGVGGGKPVKSGGSELCRSADRYWRGGKGFGQSFQPTYRQAFRGVKYTHQPDCVAESIRQMSSTSPDMIIFNNTCTHPIIIGVCRTKYSPTLLNHVRGVHGPVAVRKLKETEKNEYSCNSVRPKPKLYHLISASGKRPDKTNIDVVDSEFLYWAFTCER